MEQDMVKQILAELKGGIRKAMAKKMMPKEEESPVEAEAMEVEGEEPVSGESEISEMDLEKLKKLLDAAE